MGFYSDVLFPMGFDFVMERSEYLIKYRKELVKDVKGKILEIGFGSGLNLSHYPTFVNEIYTVDPNPGLGKKALARINKSPINVKHRSISSEALPFPAESFDSIVCSWTLCSIPNIDQALREINRVLKTTGQFYFIEHGLSRDKKIIKWQNWLNPIQKVWAVGCHLNRDMKEIIERHLTIIDLQEFYMEQESKTVGYTYQGIASKKK